MSFVIQPVNKNGWPFWDSSEEMYQRIEKIRYQLESQVS